VATLRKQISECQKKDGCDLLARNTVSYGAKHGWRCKRSGFNEKERETSEGCSEMNPDLKDVDRR
jgi:hypothetical protein